MREDFLDAALQAVDADHGGIEHYLSRSLGLSPAALAALAARYLQDEELVHAQADSQLGLRPARPMGSACRRASA